MASPITLGTTAIIVVPINKKRANIRFQNTSATQTVYIKKIPLTGPFTTVSITDYDVRMLPDSATGEGGEPFETNSIASFMAIASAAAATLAIYETNKVNLIKTH